MIKNILDDNGEGRFNSKRLDILQKYFPNCFENGKFLIDKFKKETSDELDFSFEGYHMDFLGKNYAKYIADSLETETVLEPNQDKNEKPENKNSKNIYITGDNLDVLKHLRRSYTEQIKMIYIDPPYNTGEDDFVYKDSYKFTVDELTNILGVEEEEAERILNMTSSNSSSHSAWLTFMYPRLFLARELLNDKGVIFISIDDNEGSQLKLLCDDIFGESNFVASFAREKRTNRENRKVVSSRHDIVLCYCKQTDYVEKAIGKLPMSEKALSNYKNPDDDPRGLWKSDPATAQAGHGTKDQFYVLKAPNGKEHHLPSGRCWVYTEKAMREAIEDNRIWFGKDGNAVPRLKTYLNAKDRGLTPESIWFSEDIATNEIAKNGLKELFDGYSVFETPKPVDLVRVMIQLTTDTDDIVLDFFSGSATTAHAVLEQNAVDKGRKNRKFIQVQIGEPVKKGSVAEKQGYKTIDEIGRERIVRASRKIQEEKKVDIDYGFKHYFAKVLSENTLDNLKEFDPNFNLADFEIKFDKPTILTTWLNQDSHGLTPDVNELDLKGYTAYLVKDYLYLLDEGLASQHIDALLSKIIEDGDFNPTSIVVYGYNFKDFSVLTQLETNLKQLRNEDKSIEVSLIKRY
ncbi:site-specific DNA-methyltransferase [Virgibacillus doumboii]|uniref:site-specific DNA-methyltransferase n=1 Tax=Virgibacillus doumboii TaxID=2697503 RepID=UPI0013E04ED8|nr:site-specific DNA-methyltransferase [Virgibacillus doumboii]